MVEGHDPGRPLLLGLEREPSVPRAHVQHRLAGETGQAERPPLGGQPVRRLAAVRDHPPAEIDGVPVDDLDDFRVCRTSLCFNSPIFTVVLPPDNILGVPAGPATSMSDGFYVMLRPLRKGKHSIHFHGFIPAANFAVDVSYAPLTIN